MHKVLSALGLVEILRGLSAKYSRYVTYAQGQAPTMLEISTLSKSGSTMAHWALI
jgi:hypothetical protein